MKVRLLADADLNKAINQRSSAQGASHRPPYRSRGGLRKMEDLAVLALAAEQRRVLVSHDVGTMPTHFRAFTDAGKHSSGVFLVAQSLDIGTPIEELLLIWLASESSEWENRLEWLPLQMAMDSKSGLDLTTDSTQSLSEVL